MTACRITPDPSGRQAEGIMELKEFGTKTVDWLALCAWLAEAGIVQVALESPGESWKPVLKLPEGTCEVCLVKASRVRQVPGRKTDMADVWWRVTLMRYGLLQASFIPPKGSAICGP